MKKNRVELLLLVAILIVAAFFRFNKIMTLPPGLYPDEAMNGNNALEAIATHNFKVFYPENNGREGLFINIQAVFLKILLPLNHNQPAAWMLRLPSAFFGILTVLGVFFLTKELFKKIGLAALASFLTAVSFWHINFSRIGFRAIMAPFFLTWASYFLIKSFRNSNSKFYFLNSIFSGVLYGLGFYSYIAYRATPALILFIVLFYWFKNKERGVRKKILLSTFYFLFSTLIVVLPLAFYFLKNPADFFGRTAQISIFSAVSPLKALALNILKTAAMFNFAGDWNWRHNVAGQPELFWPVGILFLIGVFLSIKNLTKKPANDWKLSIPLVWLVVAALPVVVSNESLPHALRSLLMIPPVFIIAGFGGLWLYEKAKRKRLKIFASVLFLIFLIGQSYLNYFKTWGENLETKNAFSQNYVDIARVLNSLPKEMPKYVIVQSGGTDVRGFPMPTQTVMFLTDTFLPKNRAEKNIHYVFPGETIPARAFTTRI